MAKNVEDCQWRIKMPGQEWAPGIEALGGAGVTQDQHGTTWKNGRLKEVGFFRLVGAKYVIPVAPRSMSVERLSLGISDT